MIKKGDGDNVEWNSDTNGKVTVDGDKIIIKKDDGTTEEIRTEGKNRVIIRKDANGKILTEDVQEVDGENTFIFKNKDGNVITEDVENADGRKVIIIKDHDGNVTRENIEGPHKLKIRKQGGMGGNEMLRTTIALLMYAPQGTDVSYKFVGMGNVDGNTSNIIDVTSNGSTFKLYLDAATNLPQMISYQGHQSNVFIDKTEVNAMSKDAKIEFKKSMGTPVENQIKFSDFRNVGNLLLPHRWTEISNGKQSQTIDITGYEINPANIASKFDNQKVFVRKMKPNN